LIKKVCPICNKIFYVFPSAGSRKYCSRTCYHQKLKNEGPWNKGIPRSEETKKKLRAHPRPYAKKLMEALWSRPSFRKKHLERLKKNNPAKRLDVRKKMSAHHKSKRGFPAPYKGKKRPNFSGENHPCWKPKVLITCQECGIIFKVRPHRADAKYCSKTCSGRARARKMNKNKQNRRKALKSLRQRPTKPEQRFIEIIKNHNFPFKYTGDGEVFIGSLNPDFINKNGEKQVIEVFSRAFHHPAFSFVENIPWYQQYFGRMACYAQQGYNCLILWDNDLQREEYIAGRVDEFLRKSWKIT